MPIFDAGDPGRGDFGRLIRHPLVVFVAVIVLIGGAILFPR